MKVPQTTLTPGDLDAVERFAREVGAFCASAPLLVPRKDGNVEPLRYMLPPERLARYYAGRHETCELPVAAEGDRANLPLCAAGNWFACIAPNGDVLACTVLPVVAGNVRERSFREVWQASPWLQRLRQLRRRDLPVCSTCPASAFCDRCSAEALLEHGDLAAPVAHACARAHARIVAMEKKGSLPVLKPARCATQ